MKPPPANESFNIHQPKKSNTVVWVVVGILCGGFCLCLPIGGAILFPVFSQARMAARKTMCLSNQKQVVLAELMYSNDYDDVSVSDQHWTETLTKYSKSSRIFKCPVVRNGYGYGMNEKVSGVKTREIKDLATTIFSFDSEDLSKDAHSPTPNYPLPPRHGGNTVSFMDGHARRAPTGAESFR